MKPVVVMSSSAADITKMFGVWEPARVDDEVSLTPDLKGEKGRAWKINLDRLRQVFKVDKAEDAGLAGWIVEAPWAHPVWHSYAIGLIHLRPIEGQPPPVISREGATHEMFVYALDPSKPRQLMVTGFRRWGEGAMVPVNYVGQFIEVTDELAVEQVEKAVRAVIDGRLSPDSDNLRAWAKLFGSDLIKPEYR